VRKDKHTLAMRKAADEARSTEITGNRKNKKAATQAATANMARVYHESIRVDGAMKEVLDAVKAPALAKEAAARADDGARRTAKMERKKVTRARLEARV
jgi:hypothetical protein